MTGIMMHNMSHKGGPAPVTLVFNLDAANYSAVPTNASTDATGNFTLTVSNTNGRITWSSDNGGVFRSAYIGDAMGDYIAGGPNYGSGNQSFTIFIAYKLATSSSGRLLNTNNETLGDFVMGSYNGHPKVYFTGAQSINLSSVTADTVWHLDWATFNRTTGVANLYSATSTQPTTYAFTATNSSIKGPNQLRLFNRASGTEAAPADIGVIKVWNGELTLAQIQTEWAAYYTRYYGNYMLSMSGSQYFNINPASVSTTATIEGWFYCNAANLTSNVQGLFDWIGSNAEFSAYFNTLGALHFANSGGTVNVTASTGTGYTPTVNTWMHYAFTWNSTSSSSTTYTAYMNGYCIGTATGSGSHDGSSNPLNSVMHVAYNGSGSWRGYVRDFRISNTLRYTGSTVGTNYFTPASRGSVANDANTLALFSLPTSTLADSSSNNLTVTNTGVTTVIGT